MTSRSWTEMGPEYNALAHMPAEKFIDVVQSVPVYRFETFYHPYACEAIQHLNRGGVDQLLAWPIGPGTAPTLPLKLQTGFVFEDTTQYDPDPTTIDHTYPREILDFGTDGRTPYSQYNWELFFHVPFLIACRLSQNQRFFEAQKWFHYIFDSTDRSQYPAPARFWKMRGF